MNSLRESIIASRTKNCDSRYFIPEDALESLLDNEAISRCVGESLVEVHKRKECIDYIHHGGCKIFAILVMMSRADLIVSFLERDQMPKRSSLDSKLPFTFENLKSILPDSKLAQEFYERQWELSTPFFKEDRAHRTFPAETILPFIESEELARGGFGRVFEVLLPGTHHGFTFQPRKPIWIVRKEIDAGYEVPESETSQNNGDALLESQDSSQKSFENEERILSLIRALRHPNMLQLYASYSLEKSTRSGLSRVHNLLFPLADCSLATLMWDKNKDALRLHLVSEENIFRQFYGLASAIESFHNYYCEEYQLELIGCHYDLNPRNILIRDRSLLLADFGLSQLRKDTSKSIFKEGKGNYLAPECEPIEGNVFGKGAVGRASDVWSLGCILLEVLTHLQYQAYGVAEFRKLRKAKMVGWGYTAYQFHEFGRSSSAVHSWMDRLQQDIPSPWNDALLLAKDMICIEPEIRPRAREVTSRLFLQSQRVMFELAGKKMYEIKQQTLSLEAKIEYQRLVLWGWSAGLLEELPGPRYASTSEVPRNWLKGDVAQHEEIDKSLVDILEELNSLEHVLLDQQPIARPLYVCVRSKIDKLWSFLPGICATKLAGLFEDLMINTEDVEELNHLQGAFQSNESYRQIALLAATKAMTIRIHTAKRTESRTNLLIEHITWRKKGIHKLGKITIDGQDQTVLIELMSYDPQYGGLGHESELHTRVEGLAHLLHRSDYPNDFRILTCVGYYHVASRAAFALVYRLPHGFTDKVTPTSLKDIIQKFERPILGTLFRLADILVRCVIGFHKTHWLHKNISAWNIVFFHEGLHSRIPQSEISSNSSRVNSATDLLSQKEESKRSRPLLRFRRSSAKDVGEKRPRSEDPKVAGSSPPPHTRLPFELDSEILEPYLVGFSHSRPDGEKVFTTGPSRDKTQTPYQHPDYRMGGNDTRFRPKFDYYSIGLVLLEIGLWQTLEELATEGLGSYPPTQLRSFWIDKILPRLGSSMGAQYRDAVHACLRFNTTDANGIGEDWIDAQVNILDPISKCVA